MKELDDHDDEEETLSLCDLPINDESRKDSYSIPIEIILEDDFKFCDPLISKTESDDICVADDVFFQGQILPFRHSLSSCDDTSIQNDVIKAAAARRRRFSIPRSDSLDHSSYSDGLTSGSSTRSSSINSHHSSTSSATAANSKYNNNHLKPPRVVKNHFQYINYSHPSPKPQIRSSSIKKGSNLNKKSGLWSLFRLGLMTPPTEIAIQDLKNRNNGRNSNISFSSSSSKNRSAVGGKKKSPLFMNKSGVFFGGSCKSCTVSSVAVDRSKSEENVKEKFLGEPGPREEEEEKEKEKEHAMSKKKTKHGETRKQTMSRHRTFEWLKQLSLEDQM